MTAEKSTLNESATILYNVEKINEIILSIEKIKPSLPANCNGSMTSNRPRYDYIFYTQQYLKAAQEVLHSLYNFVYAAEEEKNKSWHIESQAKSTTLLASCNKLQNENIKLKSENNSLNARLARTKQFLRVAELEIKTLKKGKPEESKEIKELKNFFAEHGEHRLKMWEKRACELLLFGNNTVKQIAKQLALRPECIEKLLENGFKQLYEKDSEWIDYKLKDFDKKSLCELLFSEKHMFLLEQEYYNIKKYFADGKTLNTIAKENGYSIDTVRKYLYQGIRRLMQVWKPHDVAKRRIENLTKHKYALAALQ